jgi:hypothetical protein
MTSRLDPAYVEKQDTYRSESCSVGSTSSHQLMPRAPCVSSAQVANEINTAEKFEGRLRGHVKERDDYTLLDEILYYKFTQLQSWRS